MRLTHSLQHCLRMLNWCALSSRLAFRALDLVNETSRLSQVTSGVRDGSSYPELAPCLMPSVRWSHRVSSFPVGSPRRPMSPNSLFRGVTSYNGIFYCRAITPTSLHEVGGQAVLGRQNILPTPWLTERHGYDPTSVESSCLILSSWFPTKTNVSKQSVSWCYLL